MHAEYIHVTQETADKVNACTGRVIAIGTTSLRALETAARNAPDGVRIAPFDGDTDIYIYPGQKIRSVDGLLTNFHQPGSTLLLLVATLLGIAGMKAAYEDALEFDYR
jgi:S-adenosylmethionine:tRNA ribosyltransferase-isomerase